MIEKTMTVRVSPRASGVAVAQGRVSGYIHR